MQTDPVRGLKNPVIVVNVVVCGDAPASQSSSSPLKGSERTPYSPEA